MKIICPCCKEKRTKEELTLSIDRKIKMWGSREIKIDMDFLSKSAVDWACDFCFKGNKAIIASFDSQKYIDFIPRLAYFDKLLECKNCGIEFLFSKEEQKFWYEHLKFLTQSECSQCKNCRKKMRVEKVLNAELSNLLKDKLTLNKANFKRISAIYKLLGKEEKSKEYLAKSKK